MPLVPPSRSVRRLGRIGRGAAATLLALLVALAAGSASAADDAVMKRIVAAGKLRVGMSGDAPPMNVRDKQGNLIGLEVDLARALADSMGVQAELVQMPFAELIGAVESGKVDIVLSNVTMTPKRNTRVAFVGPYLASGKAVLTKSKPLAESEDPEQLDKRGLTLVALKGSTSEALLRRIADDAKVVTTATHHEAVEMVVKDQADAMLADFPLAAVSIFRNPDAGLAAVTSPLTFEPIGAVLPPDAPLLQNLVRNYMTLLEGTGMLQLLRTKWFDDGSWLAELP